MSQDEYRTEEPAALQRLEQLHNNLTRIQQQYDLETREEERIRLEPILEGLRNDLTQAENDYTHGN